MQVSICRVGYTEKPANPAPYQMPHVYNNEELTIDELAAACVEGIV